MSNANPFADAPIIYRITRAQLIEDGALVVDFELDGKQVTLDSIAREKGIRFPVAMTAELFADVCKIPPRFQGWQSVMGRLQDIFWMLYLAIRAQRNRTVEGTASFHYKLIMHVGRNTYYTVKVVFGPDDNGQPCITLLKPGQD